MRNLAAGQVGRGREDRKDSRFRDGLLYAISPAREIDMGGCGWVHFPVLPPSQRRWGDAQRLSGRWPEFGNARDRRR